MTSVIRGRGRRCDARCYDGATPRDACRCICGGRNHGVGLRRAEANTIELFAAAAALEGAQPAMPLGGAALMAWIQSYQDLGRPRPAPLNEAARRDLQCEWEAAVRRTPLVEGTARG